METVIYHFFSAIIYFSTFSRVTNVDKTIINHPPNQIFYRWYGYHSQSWQVYGIVLPTSSGEHLSFIGVIMGYTIVKIGIINQC